jgi:hypothetical protein
VVGIIWVAAPGMLGCPMEAALHSLRVFAYFTQLTQDRLVWHALTTCLGSLYGPGRPEDTA